MGAPADSAAMAKRDSEYQAGVAQMRATQGQAAAQAQNGQAERQGRTEAVLGAHKKRAAGRVNRDTAQAVLGRMKARSEAKRAQAKTRG